MFGHFEALVLSLNRKGFSLEVDFGASWAMFRPILGHFGAPRRPAGLQGRNVIGMFGRLGRGKIEESCCLI